MAKILFADNAKTTMSGTLAQGGMTINVQAGGGARFPAPTGGDFFYATLYQKDGGGVEINIEIVKVSAKPSADIFTIAQRDVTSITGYAGGYAYPGTAGTVYFELRWLEKGAAAMMQAADLVASAVANTPAGNIAATTVQAALNELDTEKASLASPNFSGTPTKSGTALATTSDVSTSITNERSAAATLTNKTLDASTSKIGTLTGLLKASAGTPVAAVVRTDYAEPTTGLATGILKNTTGTGAHTIAVAGTDYQAPLVSGTNIKSINGSTLLASGNIDLGGAVNGLLKCNGAASYSQASAGVDYVAPGGSLGTPSSGNLSNCTFPTLNQNTTGTASNVTGTVAVGNGGTGLTAPGASGNVLTSNGTAWVSSAPSGGASGGAQVFTSSGTFTIPAGVSALKVTVIGGGGNGGSAITNDSQNSSAGGGGGGGGVAIKYLSGMTPGNTLSVTVGAAGVASTVASGTQAISTITGGAGSAGVSGVNTLVASGGAGGSGSGGDFNYTGGNGAATMNSTTPNWKYSGGGGSSNGDSGVVYNLVRMPGFFGGYAPPGVSILSTSVGTAATGYGNGGSGGVYVSSGSNNTIAGGGGSQGVVLIEW